MSSIQAGDVVVCVDDGPCKCGHCPGDPLSLTRRNLYRAKAVFVDPVDGIIAVTLRDYDHRTRSHPYSIGIAADRFRKVEKAKPYFIAQIKACRPKRDRVSS